METFTSFNYAAAVLLSAFVTSTHALATYTPTQSLSYVLGLPSLTDSNLRATPQPLYIQISAPATYQWVGIGIGSQMAGAQIFVIYADGSGNLSISARNGVGGDVEPVNDATLQMGVTLLEGSGIENERMIGNFLCTTCTLSSAESTPFIAAWYIGNALSTASLTATLPQHARGNYRQFAFDHSSATYSPLLPLSSLSSLTNPLNNPFINVPASATPSTGSGSVDIGAGFTKILTYQIVHGVILGVVFVLIFPFAAAWMRVGMKGSFGGHAVTQVIGSMGAVTGLGIGMKLAQDTNQLFNNTHTILGLVVIILLLLQPIFGLYHHATYVRTHLRSPISHVHIWLGRLLIGLGAVNGGLGLQLAGSSQLGNREGIIAYAVVAGAVGIVYAGLVATRRGGYWCFEKEKKGSMRRDGVSEGKSLGKSKEGGGRERIRRIDGRIIID